MRKQLKYALSAILGFILLFPGNPFARAAVISNTIKAAINVNHLAEDPVFKEVLVNMKRPYDVPGYYTPANLSGYTAEIDLSGCTANSIKFVKMSISRGFTLFLTLPEYGEIKMGALSDTLKLIDLSSVSSFDSDGDGIKTLTLQRLGAKDNDGDDTKLTIPGILGDVFNNQVTNKSEVKIVALLPKVAVGWGDNSHIKDASYNLGRLIISKAAAGEQYNVKILARSNQYVPKVHYAVAETLMNGEERILGTSEDTSIEAGIDIEIVVPITIINGSSQNVLKVYAVE